MNQIVSRFIQRIANIVVAHMGDHVSDAHEMLRRWTQSYELRNTLNAFVLPLSSIDCALSRRAEQNYKTGLNGVEPDPAQDRIWYVIYNQRPDHSLNIRYRFQVYSVALDFSISTGPILNTANIHFGAISLAEFTKPSILEQKHSSFRELHL
jgi:hypothetical protein